MRMFLYLLFATYYVMENPRVLQTMDLQYLPWFAPGVLLGLLVFYGLRRQELLRKLIAWMLLITPFFKPIQPYFSALPGGTWSLISLLGGYFCIYFYLECKYPEKNLDRLLWQNSSWKNAGLNQYFADLFLDILIYMQLFMGLAVVASFSLIASLVSSNSILTNHWIDGSINLLIAALLIGLMEPLEVKRCS